MHASAALACALLASPFPAGAAQVWTTHATEKIRPSAAARDAGSARISAARNESEAFQVVVTGEARGVTAAATDLVGPATIGGVRLYREALITLWTPSALDGGTGPWPDALVPDVDEVAHERRWAFPFDVPAGESRAVWVEVHVPDDAPAGVYHGEVAIAWQGGGATVPVTLTVWPFTLPSTASLKSAFGLYYGDLPAAHGVSGDAFSALRALYGQFAVDHRVTLSKIDDGNPDLAHLTAFYGEELDGTAATALAGARLTALEFVGRSDYASWASWFDARGWSDRLFQYTCDEPPITCAWTDIPLLAQAARAVSPPLRTLVTTTIQEADANGVTGSIDVIVPVVNFMDDKPGSGFAGDQRAAYGAFLAASPSRELWTYQSCMSHGCGGTVNMGSPSDQDLYFTGWPTYVIDAAAVRNRAMEWLSFKNGATGELYYETTMAYSHDPWNDQWDFNGNGDGTLFYPGTPSLIGGTTDIPVASIRLKMIREGMEDYEYLRMLADAGEGDFARGVVDALFPHPYSTDIAPEALLAARETLAARIVELGLSGADPGVAPDPVATTPGPIVTGAGSGASAGDPSPTGCASGGAGGLLAGLGVVAAGAARRRRARP